MKSKQACSIALAIVLFTTGMTAAWLPAPAAAETTENQSIQLGRVKEPPPPDPRPPRRVIDAADVFSGRA